MVTDPESFFSIPDKNQRDMLWSLFGPSLLNSSVTPELTAILPELEENALRQATLSPDFSSARLGFRFEQLWQTALDISGVRYKANLQISESEQPSARTLGELDLLIPRACGSLHIELALKFYLGVDDDWIGPNRRDLLSRKISHTFNHQLPLAATSEATSVIARTTGLPVTSYAIMRGCLFRPAHGLPTAPLPTEINDQHWSGFWCPAELSELLPDGEWYVLSKQDWLSPVRSDFAIPVRELRAYLDTTYQYLKTPLAVACMQRFGHVWGETERWMIVPPGWHQGA